MKIFLVGGAVRDQLLDYPYTEKDWVVTGATPEALIAKGFVPTGKDFPVFLHPQTREEYALARTERKTAPGYKGFVFHTNADVTLHEDLLRRDLTINAIARDNSGTLVDPYHGQQDLHDKVLRHVSPAFGEDPVRVLRVARFAARYHHLGFTVADTTLTLMQKMVKQGETKHLVAERVWQECVKAFTEKNPEQFFSVLNNVGALQDTLAISETCSLLKAVKLLSHCASQCSDPVVRFAIFCFPFSTQQQQDILSHLHPAKAYQHITTLVTQHYPTVTNIQAWDAIQLARLFQLCDVLRKPELFEKLITACHIIHNADTDMSDGFQPKKLSDALQCYRQVNPQALIKQGYQKSELGKAIHEQRIKNLQQWLNQTAEQ